MEVRCTKNNRAIRFQIPPHQDPIPYAKSKLREMTGKKKLRGWSFEIIE